MTPADFRAFLTRMGWSDRYAARQLGASRNSIVAWKEHGAPRYIGLACLALAQMEPGRFPSIVLRQ
jgi:hypothetical protein